MKKNNKLVLFLAFVGVFLLGITFLVLTPKKANAEGSSIDDTYGYEYINNRVYTGSRIEPNATIMLEIELELYYFMQGQELYLTITPWANIRVYDALYNNLEYYYSFDLPVINGNNEYTITTDIRSYQNYTNSLDCAIEWNFLTDYRGGGYPNNIINCALRITAFGETKLFNNSLSNVLDENNSIIFNTINTNYIDSFDSIPLNTLNTFIATNNLDYDVNETFEIGSFLVNSVGAFFDFELAPGLSISSIFMIIISGAILAFIIKIFFGG